MSNPHPSALLVLLDELASAFPHTAPGLQAHLGLVWQFGRPPSGPAHFESDTIVELADGTRITHVTHIPADPPHVVAYTGLALEDAPLTHDELERRYGPLKLVAAPSPNGSGPGKAWVYEVPAQGWTLRWVFLEGSKAPNSVAFRAHPAA